MPADTTLTCRDCGQAFTFTSGEQAFYASRGFSEPGRCPGCRALRKAQQAGGATAGGGRGPRQTFQALCSNCGNVAQLPFQPRGDKPVYCSDCFERKGGAGHRPGGWGRA
jgi:CxxC-x17-CxxC domain-containing protein